MKFFFIVFYCKIKLIFGVSGVGTGFNRLLRIGLMAGFCEQDSERSGSSPSERIPGSQGLYSVDISCLQNTFYFVIEDFGSTVG
jgi:hypothetical protein